MTHFTLPLGIESLKIIAQTVDNQGNIIFDVQSTADGTPCHKCGQFTHKRHSLGDILTVRHLPILDQPVYLRIRVVRYQCTLCNNHPTTSEQYAWMTRKSKTTKALDRYINRMLIGSTVEDVCKKERISYDSVASSLMRMTQTTVDWTHYQNLETIGIDEIALQKGHGHYITIVSTKDKHDNLSVIAVLNGRHKETVKSFLQSIPSNLQKTVKTLCTDMYDGFVQSGLEIFGSRVIVIDRYHVAKLYRQPVAYF